jgi:hypothetical protein
MAIPRVQAPRDDWEAYFDTHGSPAPVSKYYEIHERIRAAAELDEWKLEYWPGEREPRRVRKPRP